MVLTITGEGLTVEAVLRVARNNEQVRLCDQAAERIRKCRAVLEEKLGTEEVIYGVNTGIGEFSETRLKDCAPQPPRTRVPHSPPPRAPTWRRRAQRRSSISRSGSCTTMQLASAGR